MTITGYQETKPSQNSGLCLLVSYNTNDTSLYTDLADPGLSQLISSCLGEVILGVGFCSYIHVMMGAHIINVTIIQHSSTVHKR